MPQSIIKSISVEDLFGKFSYKIPRKSQLQSPVILYGDNGVGKSTILNLAFHLLSSAGDKGHRTALQKIPFSKFSVTLTSGHVVSAKRNDGINDSNILLEIYNGALKVAEWDHGSSRFRGVADYDIDELNFRRGIERGLIASKSDYNRYVHYNTENSRDEAEGDGFKRGEQAFLEVLGQIAPKIFYLNADRKLDGDGVLEPTDNVDLRRMLSHRELKSATDILRISRDMSLNQALDNAGRWVNRRAVTGANRGAENTHSTYESIIDKISVNYKQSATKIERRSFDKLAKLINKLETETAAFSNYELTAPLSMEKFRQALRNTNEEAASISFRLIDPYVIGLVTRIDAIRPLYEIVDNFVNTINTFLSNKTLEYTLSQGFFIQDINGDKLDPANLSSGEQQLLLIFSYVLSARDHPSVFIIDEPEISLNIKWQRKMVRSLMSVAEESTIQFILASHSLELIAQHADSVVEIGR